MDKTLRTLLIALAVASPVASGLAWFSADAIAAVVLRAADASPLEGSREDDAGIAAEPVEEEDSEQEEECRHLHVRGESSIDLAAHAPRGLAVLPTAPADAIWLAHLPVSRGPPSHR